MLLAGCSTVCTTVAEAAKMWNLVVVSVFRSVIFPRKTGKSDFFSFFFIVNYIRHARTEWKWMPETLLRHVFLALLRCIVASIVRPKSIPDPLQDASFRHRTQSHENQIVAKVWLVSGSNITTSRRSVHIGKNITLMKLHLISLKSLDITCISHKEKSPLCAFEK